MTADDARTARVSLRFLPEGRYRATVWEDGKAPDQVRRSERIVTARDTLALGLSAAGGAAVILEPVDR
jgi:alpha-glucosidase